MNEPAGEYVGARSCEGCTLCCKLLKIEALDKPRSQWCAHCDVGAGCKIYEERPSECQNFHCGYLTMAHIDDHWKPANSKMVIALATDANRLTVFVDPDHPDTWRQEPYYSDIKNWARTAVKIKGRVVVSLGNEVIVVTPDGETNLGTVNDDQIIIAPRKRGSSGDKFEHMIVDRDDPVLEAMRLLKDPEAAKNASPEELAEAKRQVDAWLAHQDK
jgi:hypothetical protein